MWPLPRCHFQWREPQEFVRARLAAEKSRARWWSYPGVAVVILSAGMLVWWSAPRNSMPLSWALALSLALGLALSYGLPRLLRFIPSHVSIFEKKIQVSSAGGEHPLLFSSVTSFCWRQESGYRVLTMRPTRGQVLEIGVPYEISTTEVSRFLRSRGLKEESPSV